MARATATAAWEIPWSLYDATTARLLRMPALGLTRELQERSARLVDAGMHIVRASGPYAILVADAGVRCLPAVARRLASTASRRRFRFDGQAAAEAVIEGCEAAFDTTLESSEYGRAQGRLMNAITTYRQRERELAAVLLRYSDVASRNDLEDLGRSTHALRREVRALARQVRQRAEAGNDISLPDPAPGRSSPEAARV